MNTSMNIQMKNIGTYLIATRFHQSAIRNEMMVGEYATRFKKTWSSIGIEFDAKGFVERVKKRALETTLTFKQSLEHEAEKEWERLQIALRG